MLFLVKFGLRACLACSAAYYFRTFGSENSSTLNKEPQKNKWLPISKKETEHRGWSELDVILFTGDAYVDHPAFGAAIIGRVLETQGLKVAIVPQPNWQDDLRDFKKLGVPKLFFAVTSGNMDSMINHYTANKRLRSNDAYTAGGKAGRRPDYATSVYSNILKEIFPDVPVIIGGVEASLRRFSHYDYWKNELLPTILQSSKADLLVYGNGEKAIIELANALKNGTAISDLKNINQTAFLSETKKDISINNWGSVYLHSYKNCLKNKKHFAENFKIIETESNKLEAAQLIQKSGNQFVFVNPPFNKTEKGELDSYYELPFTRIPHPRYNNKGAIPAFEMIKHSVTIHRGCFGGCAFCTISAHQGKFINSRSEESILKEIDKITEMPDFKGYLSDVGGPSANMYNMKGVDLSVCKKCSRASCIFPNICKNLNTDHQPLVDLYKKIRVRKNIKKAFIGSGIRYDLFLAAQKNSYSSHKKYFSDLVKYHISGRLKVAPEHTEDKVLQIMRKPSFNLYLKLNNWFKKINQKHDLKQQIIPYFISSHPGCEMKDMKTLADKTKKLHLKLEQIQDFTPTPMTLATVIFYSGYNPYTMEKIYVAHSKNEKLKQREQFFWHKPHAHRKRNRK